MPCGHQVAATPPSIFALFTWGLEEEYEDCITKGMTPTEILEDWDLLPPEIEDERE